MTRRVLVTGATGRLGGLVALALRDDHGLCPRIAVRRHRLEAGWQPPPGMHTCVADFDDPASLAAALEGVEAVFLVSPLHPEMRARELTLAEQAARQPTPPHVVKISGLATRLGSPVDSGRWHAEIEAGIRASGLRATFLRPLYLMQNLAMQLPAIRETGVLRAALGDASIAMVDARDVADVAAALLAGARAPADPALTLTGERAITQEELAALLAGVLGRPVRYARQSQEEARLFLAKLGLPSWHARILLQFNEAFLAGLGGAVSDSVRSVLGRAPRSLHSYLAETAR